MKLVGDIDQPSAEGTAFLVGARTPLAVTGLSDLSPPDHVRFRLQNWSSMEGRRLTCGGGESYSRPFRWVLSRALVCSLSLPLLIDAVATHGLW